MNVLLSVIKNSPSVYYIIGGGLGVLLLITVLWFLFVKNKSGIKVVKGVRYTNNEKPINKKTGKPAITYNVKDKVLKVNYTYEVGKGKKKIAPGKYTIFSSDENYTSFNIRIGNTVRSFKHNTEIVLSEGEKLSPTTIAVILR